MALRAKSTQSGAGPSDAALVVAAAAGERWAQEALFRRYARLVNGLSLRLIPNRADAEDLAQDAFVQAFAALHRLENKDALSSFLCSIVVRTAHKRVRRERLMTRLGLRRPEPVDLDALISKSAPPDAAAELRKVYSVLEELPAEDRIALVLRRVEGMALTEIAEHLGRSLATVKRRVGSAEAFLALRFGGPGRD
ncbi:MAG TPA: sigma-70 family RNA polymerase sigma factor [Polyangiaceae bacterium]|nr:sigma-70 family RNA polymerase sigma factor [Polyangiaceae bacterium]